MSAAAYDTAELRHRSANRSAASGSVRALGLAAACLLALVLIWMVAEHIPAVRVRDALTLYDFTRLDHARIDASGNLLLELLEPSLFILWGGAITAVALIRRRPRTALAAVGVLALAPFTSETLKPLLAHPHVQVGGVHVGPASWPSGHSTAALALVLSAVLVAPARLRSAVALVGAAFALAVGVALLILAWHMPSDVLGGYLVAALWMALALAALRAGERRWPTRRGI